MNEERLMSTVSDISMYLSHSFSEIVEKRKIRAQKYKHKYTRKSILVEEAHTSSAKEEQGARGEARVTPSMLYYHVIYDSMIV